jgi:hypothetical protein
MKVSLPRLALCIAVWSTGEAMLHAQCGTQIIPGYTTPSALGFDSIRVQASGLPAGLSGIVSSAMALWDNSPCNTNAGNSFPYFQPNPGADLTVTVTWVPSASSSGACADFNTITRRVNLYAVTVENGQTVNCMGHNPDALAEALAHELGHFLGLADTPSYCYSGMMMSGTDYSYATGVFTRNPLSCSTWRTMVSI